MWSFRKHFTLNFLFSCQNYEFIRNGTLGRLNNIDINIPILHFTVQIFFSQNFKQ